jgi:hypothetical protein
VVRVPDAPDVIIEVFEASIAGEGIPAFGSMAAGPVGELTPANSYSFAGGDVEGSIVLGAIDGSDQATLRFRGKPIGVTMTRDSWGFRLTGTHVIAADAGRYDLDVRVPVVNLAGRPDRFTGLAIVVLQRNSIGGTGILQGALEVYEVVHLDGSAMSITS